MRTHALDLQMRRAASEPGVISFAGGLPAKETFPRAALAQAAQEATLQMGSSPLQYDWPEGRAILRRIIADRLAARGAPVDPDDVHITNGAQDALAIAVEALGAPAIQVDHATYPGALDVFEAAKAKAVARRRLPVRYVMPAISNPYGWAMSGQARFDCLQATWVIEDDAYADLGFLGPAPRPLLADAPYKVFHVGTVSKTVSPGLRIGWLVAPTRWRDKIRAAKARRDIHACGLAQAMVERLMSSPLFDERLDRLRSHYRQRAEALLEQLPQLRGVRFAMPQGGFSVWVETDLRGDDASLLERAVKHGVAFDPGCFFRAPDAHSQRLAFRLSFSSVPLAQIAAGVQRLGAALTDARAAQRISKAA